MSVQLTILGSGSAGNSAFLECGKTRILIDAGLSGRQIRLRLGEINRVPETLNGILITHEHTDHIQGLAMIAAKLGIPVYANRDTANFIRSQFEEKFDLKIFQTGSYFEVDDIGVEVFTLPHDALDPVGFAFHTQSGKIGFVTDLGHITGLVVERLRASKILVVEANHDVEMLKNDPFRPWHLKQRIMSKHGHLSNESAAELITRTISDELKHLMLAHLSRDCNKPELALRAVKHRLDELGANHISVHHAHQDKVAQTIFL